MNKFYIILFSILFFQLSFSQNAADYFPQELGYRWYYTSTQLDSNNVPMDSTTYFLKDSLADVTTCEGYNASMIFSTASRNENLLDATPYFDTNYVSLQSSNALIYVDLTALFDTSLFDDNNFFETLQSLSGWYNVYRFGAPLYNNYTIFTKDTTISVNGTEYPLRFEIIGQRKIDENLETEIGNFTCKKFLITSTIYYLQHTVVADIPIPLVSRENYVWIAPQNWIVKEFAPTRQVDLSEIGGPSFTIPGNEKNIIHHPNFVSEIMAPQKFILYQNYPNPFNPTTNITYVIARSKDVSSRLGGATRQSEKLLVQLKVYDALGREIATLVNEKQAPGKYSVQFNANNLPSGIYFYTLRAGNFVQTRKMILLK